jgi:hypothetical protein
VSRSCSTCAKRMNSFFFFFIKEIFEKRCLAQRTRAGGKRVEVLFNKSQEIRLVHDSVGVEAREAEVFQCQYVSFAYILGLC